MKPIGIQLRRTKGWRLPPNTVVVARPSIFGNPFTIKAYREAGYTGTDEEIARQCVEAFKAWLGPRWREAWNGPESEKRRPKLLESLHLLRGKNLACWCPIGTPCHRSVLLEIANKEM